MRPIKVEPIMVEIVDVPEGVYPEEARRAWVGLVLPMIAKMPDHLGRISLLMKEPSSIRDGSYLIPISWAVEELKKAGKIVAYNFFVSQFAGGARPEALYLFGLFEFNSECCKEVLPTMSGLSEEMP